MATTLHRKDMTSKDFLLLSHLSWLIQRYDPSNEQLNFGIIYALGELNMLLPVWYQTGTTWKLAAYKEFARDAIGIETRTFRNMCRFLRVPESELVGTLYRFSMLAVIPSQKSYEPPKFRMPFYGEILGYERYAEPGEGFGFVIERRRLEGDFRQKGAL